MNTEYSGHGNVNPLGLPDKIRGTVFIDVESTGLLNPSYPISVAVQTDCGFKSQVLVKPHPDWEGYHFNEESAKIHNIPQQLVEEQGYDCHLIAEWLNELSRRMKYKTKSGSGIMFSDNIDYDGMWLSCLFMTDMDPNFVLRNSRALLINTSIKQGISDRELDRKIKTVLKENPHTHDALDDLDFYIAMWKWLVSYKHS